MYMIFLHHSMQADIDYDIFTHRITVVHGSFVESSHIGFQIFSSKLKSSSQICQWELRLHRRILHWIARKNAPSREQILASINIPSVWLFCEGFSKFSQALLWSLLWVPIECRNHTTYSCVFLASLYCVSNKIRCCCSFHWIRKVQIYAECTYTGLLHLSPSQTNES